MITYIINAFVVLGVFGDGSEKEFLLSFVQKVRYELALTMQKCKSLHIQSVPVPDSLKALLESDGLSNFLVKPGNPGVVRTFTTFDGSMIIQCCLKHCVVVVCFVIKGWTRRFTETEFPNILHECIGVDILELPVDFYF